MSLDRLLSTILLVSFLVTIVMAMGSYAAYKLRESRRPRLDDAPGGGDPFFVRVTADAYERGELPEAPADRDPADRA
jgi:hypothetical protein